VIAKAPIAKRCAPVEQLEILENGDRLTAPEFLRRHEAMPEIKKAELIEGVVYMGSPVRFEAHSIPDSLIQTWLGTYAFETPGAQSGANGTIQLDIENVPQPDGVLRIVEQCGGSSKIAAKGYLTGAPELIVEIAASSSSIDLHDKFRAYQRSGVKEYLVWRTLEREFDWFVLVEGVYQRQTPRPPGIHSSVHFPGLVLNLPALLAREGTVVLATLNQALKSKAHRSFATNLAARKKEREK
jgi:Uma2 family endonuclease